MKKITVLFSVGFCITMLSTSALATSLIWTNQSATFSGANNWSPVQAPATGDSTTFTNNTSYTVTFTASTGLLVTNSFNGKGTVTLDIGAANTWTVTNFFSIGRAGNATTTVFLASGTLAATSTLAGANGRIRVGDAGSSAGTFNVTNGTVICEGAFVGANSGDPGTLTISGLGVWTNAIGGAGTITIGSGMFGNKLSITNGGKIFTTTGTLASGNGASNNVATVSDIGSVWNSGDLIIGAGPRNQLIITNGGQVLVSNGGTVGGAAAGSNNTAIVTGAGSIWTNGTITVGGSCQTNQLIIINGGKLVSNGGTVGSGNAGSNNVAIISDAGSVWSNSGTIVVGGGANINNSLTVSNGASIYTGIMITGNSASSATNSLNLGGLGSQSSVTVTGALQLGNNQAAAFGFLTITNAAVNCGTLNIGSGGTPGSTSHVVRVLRDASCTISNALRVQGANHSMTINAGVVTNLGNFLWGNGLTNSLNTLTVTNGGQLFTGAGGTIWDIGRGPGTYKDTVIITGSGSTWDAGGRNVNVGNFNGDDASNNTLQVRESGVFTNGSLTVGNYGSGTGSSNNLLTIAAGKVAVSNLLVTATNSITFSAGTLSTSDNTLQGGANGGAAFVVGNGTSAASLELAAGGFGFHQFNDGLVITNNATLRGVGTITGSTTILGTLSPGFSIGTITTSNDLVLASSTVLDYELAAPGSSDLTAVNGNLTLDGTINLTDAGGFTNGVYTIFTYTGTLTDNGLLIGTTPTTNFTYTIDTATTGQVKLNVIGAGCPVGNAGPITGASSVTTATNGVAYSISAVAGATTYTWAAPSGASVASGQGSTSITVNYGCAAVSGNIRVIPSDGSCDGGTNTLAVTVTSGGAGITCPGNITVPAALGLCSSNVSFSVGSSGSPAPTVTCTPASGSSFSVGTTTVNCSASNDCNVATCSFDVTVNDTQAPTVSCPANIVTATDAGQCSRSNVTFSVSPSDNCPGVTNSCSPASGSTFGVGTNSVLCTAVDTSGNSNTCSFAVIVNDTENPTITCPADVVITNAAGVCCATGVTLGTPTTGDNCGVANVASNAPASFPLGTNSVTWVVTDVNGNSANCVQLVIVALANPDADSDGDGISDLAECQIGSDPLDSASGVSLLNVQTLGADLKLTWRTIGGSTNVVQVVSPVIGGNYTNSFIDLSTLFVPGSGTVMTNYLDLGGATNEPSRYYRINLSSGTPNCP